MTNINFNTLPDDVQSEIKEWLKVYDETHVTFENGKYKVSSSVSIRSHYPDDFKVIGSYKADEIFTKEERMINYMVSFHDYPIEYKGKRDYLAKKEYEKNHIGIEWTVKLENGNFVFS